ncbi:tetratricopeptide repeat protein [Aerosakkonemataceae cyanobacterium BLCC-F154]|uniref:protein O-GlcNAc transferase n=1 Tax=Floridaenema fluviatile BLCC-F154 TaxID=3153640 RepID=A0ABV4Y4Y2_9CYAN
MDSIYQEALTLHQQQQFTAAESKYREYLAGNSDRAEAWLNLGILYYQTENYLEAQAAIAKSLELDPVNSQSYYALGYCLEQTQNITEAISAYEDAIAIDPTLTDAYNNLGNLLLETGKIPEAEAIFRQAIAANPQHFGSYINLGNLLLQQNQVDLAIEVYQAALKFNPENSDILYNLEIAVNLRNSPAYIREIANQLYQEGRYEEAIAKYQEFLATRTRDATVYLAISECYKNLDRTTEVIHTLEEGIRLYPTADRLHFALITYLQTKGKTQEAIACTEAATQLFPKNYTFQILSKLMLPLVYDTAEEIKYYRQNFTEGMETLIQETSLETTEDRQNALKGFICITTFYLGHQGLNVLDLQRQWGNLIHQIVAANYPQWVEPLAMPQLTENGKIRVGYVSNYLHSYSGTLWLTGWLKNCDKENFEIYCYYTGNDPDYVTKQFYDFSDKFYQIPGNLTAVCEQVISDKLHILVFPEIGMDSQTVIMAGLRLAPVQCTAWGHPVTSGIPTIDYFLSSQLMEPENAQLHYSENLILLPNIGVSYPKPQDIPALTKTRADFGLSDNDVLYLCCQAPFKYLPQHDYIFPEIARLVPQAKFIFLRGELLKKRLERAFAQVSLNYEDYCLFLKIPTRPDYLMINLLSDVFLDTIGWSGGNTSLEAIACNLPIVTQPGEFMRGRHADSFLKMIGVTETIAQTEAEYIEIAVKLGLNSQWRQQVVARIKANQNLLFDDQVCVQALEEFYTQVVQQNTFYSNKY